MATNTTLSSSVVPATEIDALTNLQHQLPPESALGEALGKMTKGLRAGIDVTVTRDDEDLSTSQAASILGISRAHLYKILDAGLIPFHIVGERTRRMLMSDVRSYLVETIRFRAADAESIAKRDQLEDEVFNSMS